MEIEELVDKARQIYAKQDSFAAIEYLLAQKEPLTISKALIKLMRHQYWQEKDLVGALAFARAGMQFGMQAALQYQETDPELAQQLRYDAKGFAYDFASSAWVGWDEPGIEITAADHAAGRDAARMNLRLAVDLQRGDLPVSRAHWLVGAYHLADRDYDSAIASFEQAVRFAAKAAAPADELLTRGYILVIKLITNPKDGATLKEYASLKNQFADIEHGAEYVQQLETARKVFAK